MRLQIVRKRGGAERAVAFADQELGRIPAGVAADVRIDELRQRFDVLIHAPKILVLRFAHGVAESRSHGVEENQIRFVQQALWVLREFVGRRRRGTGIDRDDPARRERPHVQPHGRRTWAAVIDKRDRPLAQVLRVAARVRRVINERGRFLLFVFQQNRGRGGLVRNLLPADPDSVIGDGGFFLGGRGRRLRWLIGGLGVFFLCAQRGDVGDQGQRQHWQRTQIFHTHHRFSPRRKRIVRRLAKLRFYLFVGSPGLFCSTAEEKRLFTGGFEIQDEFGTVLDDPVRARLFEFRVAGCGAQRHNARSRRLSGANPRGRILDYYTFLRRDA